MIDVQCHLQIGPFVPEVVISDPGAVKQLHREFLRAGSDVMEAFTYYGHRSKVGLVPMPMPIQMPELPVACRSRHAMPVARVSRG